MRDLDTYFHKQVKDSYEWREQAACKGKNTEIFMSGTNIDTVTAKAICVGCVVVKACLETALANDEKGIWGGTTERERRSIKRKQKLSLRIKVVGYDEGI